MKSTDPVIQQFIDTHVTLLNHWFVKIVVAIVGTIYGSIFDVDLTNIYIAIAVVVFLDFLAGYVLSAVLHEAIWDSNKGKRSLTKLAMYAILMAACHQIEVISPIFTYFTQVALFYVGYTEIFSILENFSKAGFHWATFLVKILSFYRERKEKQIKDLIDKAI